MGRQTLLLTAKSRHTILAFFVALAGVALVLSALPTNAQAATPTYTITDLGILPEDDYPGDNYVETHDLNEAGQVVGNSGYYRIDPDTNTESFADHAWFWESGSGMQNLGNLGGGSSGAVAINELGQVVGGSRDANDDVKAFLWENGSGMQDLGTPEGYQHAYAEDINDDGEVAGVAFNLDQEGNPIERAYLWHGGTKTDMGTLPGTSSSDAAAINASGQVVGYAWNGQGEIDYRPFLWEDDNDPNTADMTELPTLAGTMASPARDINDQGHIVGTAYFPRNADNEAPSKAWLYKNGILTEVPMPSGYVSGTDFVEPWAINNSGQIVGYAQKADFSTRMTWLYSGGQMYDIQDLIPAGSGWTDVLGGRGINDAGQIAGTGINADGERHAILLTPDGSPPPPPDDPENPSQTFGEGGGTLSTDPEGDGATDSDPVETSVTTPIAGAVSISEGDTTQGAPTGFTFFGEQVNIEAPVATAQSPLTLKFVLDTTLIPAGQDQNTVEVFRNGVLVGECTGAPGTASPDPCVSKRETFSGDVAITVLTSHASAWNFAATPSYSFNGFYAPVDNPPVLNRAKAGTAIPVKFSLGGDMGLNVFAKDDSGASYPKSQQVGCASLQAGSTDQIEQTLSGEASGLSYDASSGRYTYAWKSNKGWKDTCRRFIVEFKDGTAKEAYFQFTK